MTALYHRTPPRLPDPPEPDMWKGWAKREQREQAALDFWYACRAQDARLAQRVAMRAWARAFMEA
jgi:hypothetical protein